MRTPAPGGEGRPPPPTPVSLWKTALWITVFELRPQKRAGLALLKWN